MESAIRAFIAYELPAAVIDLAADLQDRLKRQGLALRWVRPGNMHLTIKFMGEMPAQLTALVTAAMTQAAGEIPSMELTIQGMGVFPNARKPRVVWIGVGGATDILQKSVLAVEERLAALGFGLESRAFKAHLTMARINPPVHARQLLDAIQIEGGYAPKPFPVKEMVLFQSVLKPQGPLYTPLARAALGQ